MPSAPQVFRAPGARSRAEATRRLLPKQGKTSERGYGWRWQKARIPFLRSHPLCAICEKEGRVTAADTVDHIIPHKGDERLFWDQANWQALCKPCHDIKTLTEDVNAPAQTHPEWLPPPACETIVVTGPPGGGKTTWCRSEAHPGDVIIDLDECFREVCGVHGHEADRMYLKAAIRLRNKRIAALKHKTLGRAYVIVTAPTLSECEWWTKKLLARHVLIDPGRKVCASRVLGSRRLSAVEEWYRRAEGGG